MAKLFQKVRSSVALLVAEEVDLAAAPSRLMYRDLDRSSSDKCLRSHFQQENCGRFGLENLCLASDRW